MPVKIQKIPPSNPVPFDVDIPTPVDSPKNLSWNVTVQNCTVSFSTFKVDSQNTSLFGPPWPGGQSPMGGWQVTNQVTNPPSNVDYNQAPPPPPDMNHNGTVFPFSTKRSNGQVNFSIIDNGGNVYTISCLVTIT
jgi:hypothetical protein